MMGNPRQTYVPLSKTNARDGTNEPRDTEALGQRGHSVGLRGDSQRLLLQDFPCAQERGMIQIGNKPVPSKQLDTLQSFQNGRNSYCEGPFIGKGLPNSDRSQGCLFDNSSASPFPQISLLPVAGPRFRIHLSAFQANISPPCVYKSYEDCNCLLTGQRHQMCDLPRRPPADEQKPGSSKGTNLNSIRHTGSIRIFGELPQISTNTCTGSGISGIPHQFGPQKITTPQIKVRPDRIRGRPGASQWGSLSNTISPVDWQDVSSHSSNLPSAISLQKHKALARSGYDGIIRLLQEAEEDLRWWTNNLSQWNGQALSQSFPHCVIETDASMMGWGAFYQGEATGGCWSPEEQKLHINELELLAVFYALLKKERGIIVLVRSDNIAVVSHINKLGGTRSPPLIAQTKQIFAWCLQRQIRVTSDPPREGKSNSRLLVQVPKGQDRLDTQFQRFQNCQPALGSPGSRSLCNNIFNSILQLESRGHGYRCIHSALGSHTSICSSSMVPNLQSVDENTNGENKGSTNHPTVESSAMVSNAANHGDRLPNTASRCARPTDSVSKLRLPSEGQSSLPGRLEGIRQHLTAKQISSKATRLILSSWRDKTNANYNSAWKKWENWCRGKHVPPFAADVSAILSFLADEFEEGKQYRSLNCYRLAISSTHLPIEGIPVGQHPLVIRLLKGAFNLRPPKPRYSQTWDLSLMLTFLRKLGRNEELSLKKLTQKLIMLLALVLGHWCSDLVRLTLTG